MSELVLRFVGVDKTFRAGGRTVHALRGLDVELPAGGVTGLIGPDGAGKTTLLRLAAALLEPDAGRVEVLGMDTRTDADRVQAAVGYMPQRFGLYEDLTVHENLELYADLRGLAPAERPARYAELTRMTGLAPFGDRLAGRLSGGMKQKLGLACALVRPPRLLLLDEPTVGVDPVSRRELWAIVARMVQEAGTTVLLSTAYLDEAERCDRVLVLDEGRLLDSGAPGRMARQLEGRTYRLEAPRLDRRRLQGALEAVPGVLDALVLGEHIRIVTASAEPPDLSPLSEAVEHPLRLVPVAPRFEDAFIARLERRQGADGAQGGRGAPGGQLWAGVAGRDASGASSPADEVIAVRDATRDFGTFRAVDRVSFHVRRGEVFGLLGANGAGKTTTFRMLCGLLPASSGRLRVAGHDLRRAAARARGRIGYMAQRFSLYEQLSVEQNLRFFASAYRLRGARREQRVRWAIEAFELEPYRRQPAGALPFGFKQRLALGAALLHEPEVLFLDEPTSGVDPLARREFWRRINALAASGVTVLVTTHFMEEASYCDRVVIMSEGKVLAEGSPGELTRRVRSEAIPEPTLEDAFIALLERGRTDR